MANESGRSTDTQVLEGILRQFEKEYWGESSDTRRRSLLESMRELLGFAETSIR